MPKSRSPNHAGSWYEEDGETLAQQIHGWMSAVQQDGKAQHARAIIAPHAGYRYCGHVMAHAYKHINPSLVSRVFLLGPSHHHYSKRCLLSSTSNYTTPLGRLVIDGQICEELRATGHFDEMTLDVDEAEHSLELHTPYIAWSMRDQPFTLVPIMVGSLDTIREGLYGKILAPYLDDPSNLFVISSDFCHWGSRFSYSPFTSNSHEGPIWRSIMVLDKEGMDAIETGRPEPFSEYLGNTQNTICGRHPIGIFLNALQHCKTPHQVEFKHYDQSSKCLNRTDSSVSYAAAIVTVSGP